MCQSMNTRSYRRPHAHLNTGFGQCYQYRFRFKDKNTSVSMNAMLIISCIWSMSHLVNSKVQSY